MKRTALERELARSLAEERRLRVKLSLLEREAVFRRESRRSLTNEIADDLARVRAVLTVTMRWSTLLRERMRAQETP